jgi:hypothetical protein
MNDIQIGSLRALANIDQCRARTATWMTNLINQNLGDRVADALRTPATLRQLDDQQLDDVRILALLGFHAALLDALDRATGEPTSASSD